MSYPYGPPPSGPNPQQPYGPGSGPIPQPAPPYGQDPYGQSGYGAPQGYGQPSDAVPPHVGVPAEWGTRLGGYLLDGLIVSGAQIVAMLAGAIVGAILGVLVGLGDPGVGGVVGGLAFFIILIAGTFGFAFWNIVYRRGVYGQTLGQKIVKLKTVSEETGQVIGAGNAFLRQLCHVLDTLACYVGWFAPLWEPKKQTWADKIMATVVVSAETGSPLPLTKREQKEQQEAAAGGGYPGMPQPGYPQQW
ncbi:RDD family protein [Allosaccharopolyspora coralli]|uniref:RDD family protein n=1 Tax=Allosaccharopolyspora coralli TaxID=2665642 RepID=A0A5Q3Q7X5_9PSEU|nr:RDD family protein [Allosaccharopolyspora coralli]QGK69284.1 RDD family protein [Allosaccharopolyspora coralli]